MKTLFDKKYVEIKVGFKQTVIGVGFNVEDEEKLVYFYISFMFLHILLKFPTYYKTKKVVGVAYSNHTIKVGHKLYALELGEYKPPLVYFKNQFNMFTPVVKFEILPHRDGVLCFRSDKKSHKSPRWIENRDIWFFNEGTVIEGYIRHGFLNTYFTPVYRKQVNTKNISDSREFV